MEIMTVTRADELQNKQIHVVIKLSKLCLESKLLFNSETWFNINEENILEVRDRSVQHVQKRTRSTEDMYTQCCNCERVWPTKIKYKIMERKIIEYETVNQMEVKMIQVETDKAEKLGTKIINTEHAKGEKNYEGATNGVYRLLLWR